MVSFKKPNKPDFILLFTALSILAIGLIMVLSASSVLAFNKEDNSYHYFFLQLRWASLGMIAAGAALVIPYRHLKKFAGAGVIVSIFLLILVELTADPVKGSARWLELGFFSVQPSEIAKLTLIIFFAYVLAKYPVKTAKDLIIPGSFMLVVLFLVYKQPDLGTAIVIAASCGAMLLLTELPTLYFVTVIPPVSIIMYILIRTTEYQWERVIGWLHPWENAGKLGYQLVQAQIAFGSGGLFGIGIGRSVQKYGFLPENYTDTIFAMIGEEFGFFGTVFVVGLFMLLIARGYIISKECPDKFGRFLGFGLTTVLAIQTVVNLCVVTGLSPVTGITLPLISYGGSSLIITMLEIGILLNISCYRENKQAVRNINPKGKFRPGDSFSSRG
ncbi:cell division-specific peptidoglycan biosynthesis regulator FtsW [Syntrophobotulus glycolicus DSM 8271]|uniref:Probable peptidoglycan glycosyltransferase FtsW n=1 Tax=Syntrophobotulus glycolicus (strain DSM 8271 / FlGlyR) TaxID=645991 RepID=F0SYV3_SYNGF|nr:putative lipid II flippase FtsW [Syntrophobotulus glycolicus]ADY55990.1 cell division-specific peptidoglycan biosynthesis regulator FtsW [Syntrophobotulus glycolicus DSM 8271]